MSELKGDDLDKSKVYLTKLAGLKLPSNWEQMRNLSDIRNCIAHAGGRVEESKDEGKLRNLVDKVPGFSVNQDVVTGDNLIELTEDFCVQALDGVEKFFTWSAPSRPLSVGRFRHQAMARYEFQRRLDLRHQGD